MWVEVTARKDQPPGWYVSTLSAAANGRTFQAPLHIFVTGFSVPDAKDLRSLIGVMHSPEALANVYKVAPWSDEHFKLMEKSLELAGQLGNDIMYVPVIIGQHMGHQSGVIRWVKTENGPRPDHRLFEKYLDLYLRYCAAPKAISLYVWSADSAKEVAIGYEGNQQMSVGRNPKATARATQWDPRTGDTSELVVPTFLDDGAEAFWKPLLDGVYDIVVKKRGWSERVILVGLGSDTRPSKRTGELLRRWAPYARWDIYSHFSGDPGCMFYDRKRTAADPALKALKAGRMIAVGDLEVGLKEHPWGNEGVWSQKLEFLDMPLQRGYFYDQSPPLAFRAYPVLSGRLARVGPDFWPGTVRYGTPIWGIYPIAVAAKGPDGPLPTVRHFLMRESLQEFDARLTILEALLNLSPEQQKSYRAVLGDLGRRMGLGNSAPLSQAELSLNWPLWVARTYRAAEEISGAKTEAKWEESPK